VKLSISLSEEDVQLLDEYARSTGLRTRSAAVRRAIHLLRHPDLEQDYSDAWDEWQGSGEAAAWETVTSDGLDRAAR